MQNATDITFQELVLDASTPVLVDFWAEWCQPCKAMVPVLEAVAAKYEGRLNVVKVDIDAYPELGAKYGVRGLPTLMVFEGGKMTVMKSGAMGTAAVEALIN